MGLENVEFFGAVDRQGRRTDGKICSEYPAWYFDTHIDDLVESIHSKERALKAGLVHPTEIMYAEKELVREKQRLKHILESKIDLKGKDKDEAATLYKDLAQKIQDSMYTYTEMHKGLANAHEELRRMKKPIIDVKGKEKVFINMGIKPEGGKVSRDQAARAFKILGKSLGEHTDIERLRRDHKTGTYKPDVHIEEMLR